MNEGFALQFRQKRYENHRHFAWKSDAFCEFIIKVIQDSDIADLQIKLCLYGLHQLNSDYLTCTLTMNWLRTYNISFSIHQIKHFSELMGSPIFMPIYVFCTSYYFERSFNSSFITF